MKPRTILLCAALSLLGPASAMAVGPEEGLRPRRLVVCLDGTQNSPEQAVEQFDGHKLFKPTNVLKTFRAILPIGDGVSQIAFYSEGVGSLIGEPTPYANIEVWVDRIVGGAFGVGYEPRVKSAYRFLVANYHPHDQIFVFGFSRGAAEAQTLVRFVEWVGGVLPGKEVGGILNKEDEYYIAELYDGFRKSQSSPHSHAAPGKAQEVFDEIRKRRGGRPDVIRVPQEAQIEFLGVYDTVLSVGSRFAPDGKVTTVAEEYAYLVDETPPKIVKTIRHALSIDERRWDFRPQIWRPDAVNPSQSLVQRWFPGVHSNVGGGYRYDDLADHALEWMLAETTVHAPVALDAVYLKHYFGPEKSVCNEPSRPDTNTAWMKFADLIRGKSGRGVRDLAALDHDGIWERAGLGFHESLGALIISDCTYRPRNLLQYLATHPARVAEFPESQRVELRQIIEEFKARSGQGNPKPYHCQPFHCQAAASN